MRATIFMLVVTLTTASSAPGATVFFDDDGTHSIDDATFSAVAIDVRSMTTVNVVDPALIGNDNGFLSINATENGVVNISGGTTVGGMVQALQNAVVTITGGNLGENDDGVSLRALFGGRIDVFGGTFSGTFFEAGLGQFNVFGTGLSITDGILTGTLTDGTPLNNPVSGNIVLNDISVIPEPSSLVLLACGALSMMTLGIGRAKRDQSEKSDCL